MALNLNDKIEVTLKVTPDTKPRYRNYVIQDAWTGMNLYYGRIFVDAGQKYVTVYLNDIFEGLKPEHWLKYENLIDESGLEYTPIEVQNYYNIAGEEVTLQELYVDLYHPQRGLNKTNETAITHQADGIDYDRLFFTPLYSGLKFKFVNDDINDRIIISPKLIPTIPYGYNDDSYKSEISIAGTGDTQFEFEVGYYNEDEGFVYTEDRTVEKTIDDTLTEGFQIDINTSGIDKGNYLAAYFPYSDSVSILGKINCGDSKYYLKWFDRCYGIQMQPFCKNDKYKSEYTYINKINKYNEEEMVSAKVTDTVTINTGWINEELLPYYESIFTSPYLCLYNDEAKTHTKVILQDKTFEYKTFKNQGRQMFNLQLTLKLSKTENILY